MTANKLPLDEMGERVRVGATIAEFRQMRGYNQEELAHLIPISRPYLANIEVGRKPLTKILLARLAEVLNVRQAALVRPGYFADEDAA